MPGLRPRGGAMSEQRLGRSGCTGEEGGSGGQLRQRDNVLSILFTHKLG